MLNATALRNVRHGCGRVYELIHDHACGLTRSIVFRTVCDESPPLLSPPPVSFRVGGPDDLEQFTQETHEYGEAEKQFGFQRLSRGDLLIVGECGGAVVFYAWLMCRQMDLDQNVCIPIRPDAAYSYKVFTVARARGLHICAAYYRFIKDFLRPRGYGHMVCRIIPGNTASVRAHMRVGFQRSGIVYRQVLAGRAIYWADGGMRSLLPPTVRQAYFSSRGFLLRHNA